MKNKEGAKPKKPFYKRIWFWVVVVFFLLAAIGGNSSNKDAENASQTVQSTQATETQPPVETTIATIATETTAEQTEDQEIDVDTIVALIKLSMSDEINSDVYHKDGIIYIDIWNDGVASGAALAMMGNQECIDSWNQMKDSEIEFCKSVLNTVEELGASDLSVTVNVLNDMDTSKTLLSIVNGIVFYDSVNAE